MANPVVPLVLIGGGGALAWQGSRTKGAGGTALLAAGAALVGVGLGSSDVLARQAGRAALALAPTGSVTIRRQVTIGRHRHQVWAVWRDPTRMRLLIPEIQDVEELDERRWRWKAQIPGAQPVEWVSEVDDEQPHQRLTWHAGPPFLHSGIAEFRDAPGWRGTEVAVTLSWQAPLGRLGSGWATLSGADPGTEVATMLRRLKQVLETGEVVTVDDQSHGRRSPWWSQSR